MVCYCATKRARGQSFARCVHNDIQGWLADWDKRAAFLVVVTGHRSQKSAE